jgi:AIPR protein
LEEIAHFNRTLVAEIIEESGQAGLASRSVFFERMAARLEAEGEIETADNVGFEGSLSGKTLRIDGIGGDPRDSDGILSVMICDFSEDVSLRSMNGQDAKKYFNHLINFVTAARRAEFRQNLAPDQLVAGVAATISESWATVSKVKLILITNALYSARTDAVLAGKIDGIPVTYNIWDLGRFHRFEESGQSREKIVVHFRDEFGGAVPALAAYKDGAEFDTYLMVIKGSQLAQIYDKWGARLLESNVRSFLQARGSVNQGIRDTIKEKPSMFFSYNNGLSATADEVETESGSEGLMLITARNLQIVNGGQTTASLHAALRLSAESLEQVHVQMKLTVVPPESSEVVVPNISKFANSQNKVSAADFFSNHAFHMRMEDYSRRILVPAAEGSNRETKWFYERARGQYLVERAKRSQAEKRRFDAEFPKSQYFTKTDLAKAEFSFRLRPDIVSKGAQKNFAAFAGEIGEEWRRSDRKFDETWYRRLIGKLIIFRELEKVVPKQSWYPGAYRANIVTYAIAKLVDDADRKERLVDLDEVWKRQDVSTDLMDSLLRAAEAAALVIVHPESGIKNVTEWAKKQGCWGAVRREEVDYDAGFGDVTIAPDEANIVTRDVRKDAALISGIEAQSKVVELGGKFWTRLSAWGILNRQLGSRDEGILKVCGAIPSKIPSEKQCLAALELLEKARQAGYAEDDEALRIRLSTRSRVH